MSVLNENTGILASATQLISDVMLEVMGPDISHEINGEKITAESVKPLIVAELARTDLTK